MQLHQLKPNTKKQSRKRVGRGGKKGTYSGRGLKGQKSRAGRKPRLGFAGGDTTAIKRIPKKRGAVGRTRLRKGVKLSRLKKREVVLNLHDIDKNFKMGEVVSPVTLLEKGLISKRKGRLPLVKILGRGKLGKKVEFKGVKLSKTAKGSIEKPKPKPKPRPKTKSSKS